MQTLERKVRTAITEPLLALPLPGSGQTPERHRILSEWGRHDLSFARMAEAHTDALAILAEAGCAQHDNALYGVWASESSSARLEATLESDHWSITGLKQFCSGASLIDAALVTAHHGDDLLLFDVALHTQGIRIEDSTWVNPSFLDTETRDVVFDNVVVDKIRLIGEPGWYLKRPGFWHGAIGPAACWTGGAESLIDGAIGLSSNNPHSKAHRGALEAAAWNLRTILETAGREIDNDPYDESAQAMRRALIVRHLIERTCMEVVDRFGRCAGPRLLAFDSHIARQYGSLLLYIRQCHAERDLEKIEV